MKMKAGDFVEIKRNVNAIPKGVYKVLEADDWWCSFEVGKSILFSVSYHAKDWLEVLPKRNIRLTSQKSFLDRYYELLEEVRLKDNGVFDPRTPFTCCMVTPSVARKAH